ncbi:MAG: glutathione peroxidase [Betaproteobacteria bacterium]
MMSLYFRCLTAAVCVWSCLAVAPAWAQSAPAKAGADCPALLQQTVDRLQDEKPQSLCQYSGKVLLVVNTASFCGYTPQYADLEALHARYKDKGLVVLGFPSNDFAQERGSNKDIADFCESTFGVKFPMFTKTTVTGKDAHPFYKRLAAEAGSSPRWNFYKYLIGRDGKVVSAYGSSTGPQDARMTKQIEQLLAKNN